MTVHDSAVDAERAQVSAGLLDWVASVPMQRLQARSLPGASLAQHALGPAPGGQGGPAGSEGSCHLRTQGLHQGHQAGGSTHKLLRHHL